MSVQRNDAPSIHQSRNDLQMHGVANGFTNSLNGSLDVANLRDSVKQKDNEALQRMIAMDDSS